MAKTIIYNGGLGPKVVKVGGIRFEKDEPVTVEDDTQAKVILKKKHFSETRKKPAASADVKKTEAKPARAKAASSGKKED